MKRNIFIIILMVLLTSQSIAQNHYKGGISVDVSTYAKQNTKLIIKADIVLDKLRLAANDMITIIPVLRSQEGTDQLEFEPLIINGSTRNKVSLRAKALGHYNYPENTAGIIKRVNGHLQRFSYSLAAEYKSWMRSSELVFIESVTGCNCADISNTNHPGGKLQLTPPYKPDFLVAYIVPEVEAVKRRADYYSASLNYVVNRSDINRGFKNNDKVLDQVDQIIGDVKNDPNIDIDKIVVTGYASPEGETQYNLLLSQKRARAFTDYLINKHNIPSHLITTSWKGEDWPGLRAAIDQSDYPYRKDVLEAIDSTDDINKRKVSLKGLLGGKVYRSIVETYFPDLRRNSYDIFYTVRGLDLEQAKALIKVKPQQLSLNEMFMVATSYKKGSDEFKNAFAIAVTVFPDDPTARFNSLTSQIQSGSFEDAVAGLQHTDRPEGWNNIAVALFAMGDYQRALSFFEKASRAGLKDAINNLEQYKLWIESKDN